ncbi:MAG: tRNA uridine-5-carboxymethylaminomethyl(34) synthesis enzyme MnmG [Bacteroidales bacterium]|jgi:tRNA uridine 5-carboxymethylaminomethyl modification enzyme|nr:tRNA uridine-5-carboxymethylaminomethyl(34) synthesis enzyme MnmG [Bacteroidales bacterium]
MKEYDIIVVGAGHAGCEAANAAANLGSRVLLITMNMLNMAQMSCNPSIGGIAKGQIIREIDALGGYSGIITDRTMIQFRMLNHSKGPAMWSPRAQNDRVLFSMEWRKMLESNRNIDFWQDTVSGIIVKGKKIYGLKTGLGKTFRCKSAILANGTFLNGIIHIGEKSFSGGRIGERAEKDLTNSLIKHGFIYQRMKTGTPVRADGRTLNFDRMEEQTGDVNPGRFSYTETPKLSNQKSCFLTYTNSIVHEILKTGFDKSPMYTGRIKGRGPRYCPSIEDKIDRFSAKERHQLFIEPEGWNTIEYYVNGFSSSLPEEIQFKALRKVVGFEKAKFFRPGYAIEYDYFPPHQLNLNLETKIIEGLFFAGQINGTTGYEEAAAQGIIAGINAHLKINNKPEFILKRSEAYIGVLIDDLVTKGTEEPYRMFTSRAEYRILLRQDNADLRLTQKSYSLGLATKSRYDRMIEKYKKVSDFITLLKATNLSPEDVNVILEQKGTNKISQKQKAATILLRPQISLKEMINEISSIKQYAQISGDISEEIIDEIEIQIKYENYIEKEQELANKLVALENIPLKAEFDYMKIKSLSYEAREKLDKIKPKTLGQAGRISGVSPADISVLLVHFGR